MTLIIVFGMYLQIFNKCNEVEVKIFSKKRHIALLNFLRENQVKQVTFVGVINYHLRRGSTRHIKVLSQISIEKVSNKSQLASFMRYCALKTPYFAQNCVLLRIFAYFCALYKFSFRRAHKTPILVHNQIKYSINDVFVQLQVRIYTNRCELA